MQKEFSLVKQKSSLSQYNLTVTAILVLYLNVIHHGRPVNIIASSLSAFGFRKQAGRVRLRTIVILPSVQAQVGQASIR
jgi:hypothetical protein